MAEEEPPQKKRPGPKPARHAEWCNSAQNAGHKSCNCGATKKSKAKLEASGFSGDGSTSSPPMVASSSSAAVITTLEAAPLLATTKQILSYEGGALLRSPRGEESYLELENIADALDTMKGEKINGAVEELYFDAGSMKDKLQVPLTLDDAGHKDTMRTKWNAAFKRFPTLRDAIVDGINMASTRVVEYLTSSGLVPEGFQATMNTPSFLKNGNGGLPHADAMVEYSCLMALRCGSPTKVFRGGTTKAVKRVQELVGCTEEEMAVNGAADFLQKYAPLLLPRMELERNMVPVGGATVFKPGDVAVLPPGQIHQTPDQIVGSMPRSMFFFTIVVSPVGQPIDARRLYDPNTQVLPLNAINTIVTHATFPEQKQFTRCVDLLIARYVEWSSHKHFKKSMLDWIGDANNCPPSNLTLAQKLGAHVRAILELHHKAQSINSWTPCRISRDEYK